MNTEIRKLMRLRDQTHHIAIESKDVNYIRLYKCMGNRVTSELRSAKEEYFHHLLSNESPTPKAFWSNISQVMQSGRQELVSLEVNGHPCCDPTTLANAFNDYFVNIGPSINHNSGSSPAT